MEGSCCMCCSNCAGRQGLLSCPLRLPFLAALQAEQRHLRGLADEREIHAKSLLADSHRREEARREQRTLEGLGITPQGIEGIVPGYLYRYRKAGQFTAPKGIPE